MKRLVTHLAKSYYPIPGGIENLTQLFCENLRKNNIDVKVISFSEIGSKEKIKIDSVNGVEVVRFKPILRLYSQPLSLDYFIETFYSLARSQELHVHWPNFLAFFSVLISSLLRKFLFLPCADIVIHWHGDAVRQRPLKFLFSPIVKAVIFLSKRVVLSARFYSEISDFRSSLNKKEIFEAPLVVTEAFEKTLLELSGPKISHYKNGPFKIIAVGRFVWLKGFQDLIEASKYLDSDVKITILGAEDSYLNELKEIRSKLKYPENIKLKTNIPLREMILHILEADLFVMPSRQEMAGIVQMEAMLCGKAVITTDVPRSAVNYFNEKDITGLVVPVANPKALAEAITELKNNPEKLRALSQNALKKAQTHFTNEAYTKAINDYVQKYLKS